MDAVTHRRTHRIPSHQVETLQMEYCRGSLPCRLPAVEDLFYWLRSPLISAPTRDIRVVNQLYIHKYALVEHILIFKLVEHILTYINISSNEYNINNRLGTWRNKKYGEGWLACNYEANFLLLLEVYYHEGRHLQ